MTTPLCVTREVPRSPLEFFPQPGQYIDKGVYVSGEVVELVTRTKSYLLSLQWPRDCQEIPGISNYSGVQCGLPIFPIPSYRGAILHHYSARNHQETANIIYLFYSASCCKAFQGKFFIHKYCIVSLVSAVHLCVCEVWSCIYYIATQCVSCCKAVCMYIYVFIEESSTSAYISCCVCVNSKSGK